MSVDIMNGINLVTNAFTNTTIFNISWLLSIPLILGTVFLITRDKNAWGFLLLPVTIMWHALGVNPSFIWYLIVTIVFTLKLFSVDIVGNLVTAQVRQGYQDTDFAKSRYARQKELEYISEIKAERKKKQINDNLDLLDAILRGGGKKR